jgi:hypothetical protein
MYIRQHQSFIQDIKTQPIALAVVQFGSKGPTKGPGSFEGRAREPTSRTLESPCVPEEEDLEEEKPSLLRKMWRAALFCIGSVSLLLRQWAASSLLGGCDSLINWTIGVNGCHLVDIQ